MKYPVTFLISVFMIQSVAGQQAIPLYPNAIPNSKPTPNTEKSEMRDNGMQIISEISIPTLTLFLPPKTSSSPHTAVIVVPGGGYHINAMKHEGTDIAKKLNEWGIAAFVLKYRIPDDKTMVNKEIGPLQDAQQAIRTVRENAGKWNVDPNKVGIMGFSAGGHLAATATTHYDRPVIEGGNTNLRPDFVILGYPVISFVDSVGHIGSRDNLLGKTPSREKIIAYSNETQVTSKTPPAFIIHAADDDVVKPANSITFYESLLKHDVPAELHIYEKGGHGFGMDNPTTEENWMDTLRNWMKSRKLN